MIPCLFSFFDISCDQIANKKRVEEKIIWLHIIQWIWPHSLSVAAAAAVLIILNFLSFRDSEIWKNCTILLHTIAEEEQSNTLWRQMISSEFDPSTTFRFNWREVNVYLKGYSLVSDSVTSSKYRLVAA